MEADRIAAARKGRTLSYSSFINGLGVQDGGKNSGRGAAGGRKMIRPRRFRRFFRSRTGASIVEFAIIALPLFLLIFGTIEVGLSFWAGYELENATAVAARLVRTGQAQAGGWDAARLKSELCKNVVIISNCNTAVQLDVRTFDTLGGITAPPAVDGNGGLRTDFSFTPGGPGAYVLITAFYEWPLTSPLVSEVLSNLADGNLLLRASAAFKNEPFPPPA
jgi:Flp pilus assembly protein TadG